MVLRNRKLCVLIELELELILSHWLWGEVRYSARVSHAKSESLGVRRVLLFLAVFLAGIVLVFGVCRSPASRVRVRVDVVMLRSRVDVLRAVQPRWEKGGRSV